MSEVIELLRLEHQSIARVLDLLESQRGLLRDAGNSDTTLLRVSLSYLAGFPEACHHPKEDLVFRRLQARAPDAAACQVDLEKSHDRLSEATARICEAAAAGETQSEAFSEELGGFIDAYRHHMRAEERDFFPLALEKLSDDDFAALDLRVFDGIDPLVEPRTETEFHELQRELQRLTNRPARRQAPVTGRASDALHPLLTGRASIAAANEALAGHDFRLAPAGEGHALQWKERTLAEIPACSEARTVWCAHYFIRGMEAG